MPYTGEDDPNLPSNVKKLPADKRRQWIAVWNSTYKNCLNPKKGGGAGNPKDCAGVAFRFANGVTKTKELAMEEDEKEGRTISSANMKILQDAFAAIQAVLTAGEPKVKVEEKDCGAEMSAAPVGYPPKPLGGAMSLEQAEEWRAAQSIRNQVDDRWNDFDSVYQNIRNADEGEMPRDKKLTAVQALAAEFSGVMNEIRPEKKSLLEKVKDFLTPGSKEETTEEEEGEKAEWTAAFINDLPDSSFAYIEGGGKKDEEGKTVPRSLRSLPYKDADGAVDLPHLRNALARLPQTSLTPEQQAAAAAVLKKAAEAKKVGEFAGKEIVCSFKAFKEADGQWRWLTVTTNKFRDREGEIFTEEAHKEAVEYATVFGHYPELRLWHVPGSTIGHGDYATYTDEGFVLHSGTFDPGMEDVAASLAAEKNLAVSQGYKYRAVDRLDKVYDWYRTFEASVLPSARVANAWTEYLSESKEESMGIPTDKRAFLVQHMGEDRTKSIEERLSSLGKDLEEAGVDFKDLVEEVEIPKPEPAPAPEPEPEGEEKPVALTADDVRTIVQEAVAPLMAEQKATKEAIETRVAALERTDDEKVAEKVAPRRQAPGNGQSPANSDATKVGEKDQAALAAAAKEEDPESGDPLHPYLAQLKGRVGG